MMRENRKHSPKSPRAEKNPGIASYEWELTFNSITDFISIHDSDFRITRVNAAVARALGLEPEACIGKKCFELFHGKNEPWPDCPHRKTLESRKPCVAELFEPRLGRDLLVSCSPIIDERGELIGSVHIAKDVTERKRAEAALRESEEKFRNLAEHSPNMIFINTKNRIVYANRKCEEITGYTREEFYSPDFDFMVLFAPDCADVITANYARHMKGEDVPSYEYALITKEGKRLEVINASKLIRYENENAILGVVTDITEHKRVEEELRKSEMLFHTLTRISPVGIFRTNARGDCAYVNERWCEIAGITAELAAGQGWAQAIHPEDRETVAEEWYRSAKEERPFKLEYRFMRPDGVTTWVVGQSTAELDAGGKVIGYVGSITDITEQKRAEEFIQKVQREQLRVRTAAMESTTDGIIIVDASKLSLPIIYANRSFESNTGYAQEEALGGDPRFLRGPRTDADTVEQIENAFRKGDSFQGEILHYKKDGSTCWNLLRIAPVRDERGAITHFVEILTDITLMKKTQVDFERQREELLHVARVGKLGELASSIAHEINQPLAAIIANAQAAQRYLAMREPDLNELREILKDIINDDIRAGEVIRRLRSLMKKQEFKFELLDVNALIRETAALVGSDAVMRRKILKLELETDLPPVRGDRIQLQQVLLNLITNGLEAMAQSGDDARELSVRTFRKEPDAIGVAVKDSGSGLPGGDAERVFEPFYTTRAEGMGMGLPISRSIIEAHGGAIYAENDPDRGATFYFSLPLRAPEST